MSNTKSIIEAIREQTNRINKLTFKQLIEENFKDQTDKDIEEAWEAYKHNYIYKK